jgi:uncharacterized protein YjbI with pentapeptide repeats
VAVQYGRNMPGWPDWTGLSEKTWTKKTPEEEIRPAKTLWDWLQLIAVPLVLTILVVLVSSWQSGRDAKREEARAIREREIAREARLDQVLQTYITQLSALVLENKLLSSNGSSDVRVIARTLTLAAVRRLDGARKGEVVRYLADSGLILFTRREIDESATSWSVFTQPPKVRLSDADLRGADLRSAVLSQVDLSGADLRGARFDGALLLDVDLSKTYMQEASFRNARLGAVNFSTARLDKSVFDSAVLGSIRVPLIDSRSTDSRDYFPTEFTFACLTDARFRNANITKGVTFEQAGGLRVDFTDAALSGRVLESANLRKTIIGRAELHGDLPEGWGPTGYEGNLPDLSACARTPTGLFTNLP